MVKWLNCEIVYTLVVQHNNTIGQSRNLPSPQVAGLLILGICNALTIYQSGAKLRISLKNDDYAGISGVHLARSVSVSMPTSFLP